MCFSCEEVRCLVEWDIVNPRNARAVKHENNLSSEMNDFEINSSI